MRKWEYLVRAVPESCWERSADVTKWLNELGHDGWELVTYDADNWRVYMKRVLPLPE